MHFKQYIPKGVPCLVILLVIFGYFGHVMGLPNMLNTIMNTAHDLLLNTVFYLMGMCVITGALSKILVEFHVVDMLEKALRPIMKFFFNMPGEASLAFILTFLSDRPALMALNQDKQFARHLKKFQYISLSKCSLGMGLLVFVFMMGQGYYMEPVIGLVGAVFGVIVATRLMSYFVIKAYPQFKEMNAVSDEEWAVEMKKQEEKKQGEKEEKTSTFVHILNALLDGGKDGVTIGIAVIPGVLIISTLVMMLTFGGSAEGIDDAGNSIVVYTGEAYQGTQLLPWLADKISVVFNWLFGFSAPELVSFPVTALGTVGAALGLVPEFASKGIIDGNAIAVFTAMGMCWSGFLSSDAAILDTLGYRKLVPKTFLSTFIGGICAGIVTHWAYVGIMAAISIFQPEASWTTKIEAYRVQDQQHHQTLNLVAYDDSTYTVKDWYWTEGTDLSFSVNQNDSTVNILNSYANRSGYYFVYINKNNQAGQPAYAALYTGPHYSEFQGNQKRGSLYVFCRIYDGQKHEMTRGYYEAVWGGAPKQTAEAEKSIQQEINQEIIEAEHAADSIEHKHLRDSILMNRQTIK